MKSWKSSLRCCGAGTALGLALALSPAGGGAAQSEFPGKRPIQMTVLFPTGTSADLTARMLAEGMSKRLNTHIVVVNRPGGGGAVGYKYAAAQTPDGYNIVWNSNSISTTYHTGALSFDYRAFEPVARALVESPLLVVKADTPWQSLRDFVVAAKRAPGRLTVGNSGTGSHTHFSSVALFKAAGAEVLDVPFAAAQVVPSLLGGHVNAVVQLPGALAGHIKSGTVRVLAALSTRRDPSFPDVATAIEQGVNVAAELWRGVAVPKGTPKATITRLEAAVRAAVESEEFRKSAERLFVTPAYLPGRPFGEVIANEDVEIARELQGLGLKKSAN